MDEETFDKQAKYAHAIVTQNDQILNSPAVHSSRPSLGRLLETSETRKRIEQSLSKINHLRSLSRASARSNTTLSTGVSSSLQPPPTTSSSDNRSLESHQQSRSSHRPSQTAKSLKAKKLRNKMEQEQEMLVKRIEDRCEALKQSLDERMQSLENEFRSAKLQLESSRAGVEEMKAIQREYMARGVQTALQGPVIPIDEEQKLRERAKELEVRQRYVGKWLEDTKIIEHR
ncbi:uncharacterized protein BYT42DRAFT_390728 [Radiomyces spectabilis]|uniref:uncharacterized protein n=1 Tax=Radiomyces spectabilis TaxID=64574 RepID=UPI00222050A8|nr:uncharacterized protein BYT42DRAFT_390728 [Radiomyces spectabilis]KAI8376555.1 hypothetical protein BYT42DRAFT_390728 [Radiomyces spectabilis]